jgi:hypothetical protein
MVLPDSRGVSRAPRYSGISQESRIRFVYGPITLYGSAFQPIRLHIRFLTLRRNRNRAKTDPTTPDLQRLRPYTGRVWAVPVSLATTQGIALLSFPEGT